MKKLIFICLIVLITISCTQNKKVEQTTTQSTEITAVTNDVVEVIYFHGTQRCFTCQAIEAETKSLIESSFADAITNKELVLKIVDISKPENEAIADKYEVAWSSLFVNDWKNGQESVNNLTEFAFANARSNPDAFKQGLSEKINELMSN
ncbi:MAG TPA: thioredoxin [Porphyromonadaceae bacterium]|nr:thioredoxin [Porphyromonadaceae bacterium]